MRVHIGRYVGNKLGATSGPRFLCRRYVDRHVVDTKFVSWRTSRYISSIWPEGPVYVFL